MGGAAHSTYEESENTGKILGDAGKEARKLGMDTYYHNHTEEFTPLKDGLTAEDIIGSHCKLELDTYWSFCAGIDNYSYLTKNKDKIVLIHIKDGVGRKPKALGEGECDLKKVVDGVNGYNFTNAEEMYELLKKLRDMPKDELHEFGARTRESIKTSGAIRLANDLLDVYKEAIGVYEKKKTKKRKLKKRYRKIRRMYAPRNKYSVKILMLL